MLYRSLLTFLMVCMLANLSAFGQEEVEEEMEGYPYPAANTEEYKEFVNEKHHDQHDKFLDRKFNYPAAPKHKLELGLDFGALMISGDMKTGDTNGGLLPGWGVGLHLRKAFGYVFSMRLSGMLGQTEGYMWQPSIGWNNDGDAAGGGFLHNRSLGGGGGGEIGDILLQLSDGDKIPDYRGGDRGDDVYYNYQTKIRDISLSGIINLNNLKFHKQENKFNIYGIFGGGGFIYNVMTDQLDGDGNEYVYSTITEGSTFDENRKPAKEQLNDLWDGEFETQAEMHHDDYWLFGSEDDKQRAWQHRLQAHFGIGFGFKLGRVVNLGLESKVYYTDDDLLDGQRWQEWGALTRDWDRYNFTNLSLNINLGGANSVEPLWWMNPIDYAYAELNEAPCCDNLDLPDLADDDNDGVPNIFDVEPDSREECPVDTKGRMLDSDGDGILDCDDCQPYTRRDLIDKINDCGAAFEGKLL